MKRLGTYENALEYAQRQARGLGVTHYMVCMAGEWYVTSQYLYGAEEVAP